MSRTRISTLERSRRAMAPRALSDSCRQTPSGSCGSRSRYIGSSTRSWYSPVEPIGDDLAGHGRNADAIGACGDEPIVQDAVALAVDDRRARRQTGQDRQHEANSGMQAREFLVAAEWQLERRGKRVHPAVALARENLVERGVARVVWPELRVLGVEPWVHRGRHQPQTVLPERVVREPNVDGERLCQTGERAP